MGRGERLWDHQCFRFNTPAAIAWPRQSCHPYTHDPPLQTERKRVIRFNTFILAMLLAVISLSAGSPEQQQTTIKAEVALVNVVFSAFDRQNRAVPGLRAEDFFVLEDQAPQTIKYFSAISKGDLPLTIALLIDTSASIRDRLDDEKQTAAEFLRSVVRKEKDSALLIDFNSEVNLVHDFTHNPEELIAAMQPLRAGGQTALYDAVFIAVDEKLKGQAGRKVIVVITDGDDTASKARRETAIETAQKHDVLIYGIGIRSENHDANFGVLKKFAEETGGRFFPSRPTMGEMQTGFQLIREELQNQYSLAYISTNAARDGAYRSIQVRCKRGGVRIRTRKGYYAPTAQRPSAASN
jgi:VWFA-related protein